MLEKSSNYHLLFLVAAATLLIFCVGCTQPSSARRVALKTAPVSGIVRLDGNPLEGANILFVPFRLHNDLGAYQPPSHATTNEAGEFDLKIVGKDDQSSAVVGRHRVWIRLDRNPVASGEQDTDDPLVDAPQADSNSNHRPELPNRYHRDTELMFLVKEAELNHLELELTSD